MSSVNAVLYAWGLFEQPYSAGLSNQQQLDYMTGSGFTTIILWSLHVDPQGNLIYNDPLPDKTSKGIVTDGTFNPYFAEAALYVNRLKSAPGSSVKKVLFSIGSGGSNDFKNILNLVRTGKTANLQKNLTVLATTLGLDGFDLDNEDDLGDVASMAKFTLMLAGIRPVVTYCPYSAPQYWFSCLQQVYAMNHNRQAVSWFNLQCYSGGGGNDPAEWVRALKAAPNTGVTDPAAFIVPGYWCVNQGTGTTCSPGDDSDCPATIQGKLAAVARATPGITGGFIWNSFDVFRCLSCTACSSTLKPSDYANAVIRGLSGVSAAAEGEAAVSPA